MEEKLLNDIVKKYKTPIYIFDIREIKNRIRYLKSKLPKNLKICYAIKANTFIIKEIENEVDRFEVCSEGEYEICKQNKITDKKILISGVNKDDDFIKNVLNTNQNKYFTIESINQYEVLKNINQPVKAMIRLTSGNQFGITEEEVKKIIQENLNNTNIEICGIQYFSGTQKKSINIIKKELCYIDEFITELQNELNFKIKELEFGTGFPINYFENNDFNEQEYIEEFSNIFKSVKFQGDIILEIGRSLVASCGNYLTKVVDKKTNKNGNFAIVDGGMNHLVYYGQSMAMKVPKIELFPKREEIHKEKWNICGSLCTINDILIKQYEIEDLKIGDILIFKNAGAYCMTEGISLFLSRNLPQIIKIKEDGLAYLIRKNIPTYPFNM